MLDRVGNARQALSVNISQRRPRKNFGIVRVIDSGAIGRIFTGLGKNAG
jgi:hypothetical protein